MIRKRNNTFYILVRFAAKICLFPFFKIIIEGIENLPAEGAFVLLPKHQRWEDIPVMAIANRRIMYFIAKHEMFRNPLSSSFVYSVGGLPLNRIRPIESRKTLSLIIKYLAQGEVITVFPEGTYFINKTGPGNSGIFKFILSRQDVPFIPVGINYSKIKFRTRVTVKIGKPADNTLSSEIIFKKIMEGISILSGLKE